MKTLAAQLSALPIQWVKVPDFLLLKIGLAHMNCDDLRSQLVQHDFSST